MKNLKYIFALTFILVSCSESPQEQKEISLDEQSSLDGDSSKIECIQSIDGLDNIICLEKTIKDNEWVTSYLPMGSRFLATENVPWYMEKGYFFGEGNFTKSYGESVPFTIEYMRPYEISKLLIDFIDTEVISAFFCEVYYDFSRTTEEYYFITLSDFIPLSEKHWYANNIKSIPRDHDNSGKENRSRGDYLELKASDTVRISREISKNNITGFEISPLSKLELGSNFYKFGAHLIDRKTAEFMPGSDYIGKCSVLDIQKAQGLMFEALEEMITYRLDKDVNSYLEIQQIQKEKEVKDNLPNKL